MWEEKKRREKQYRNLKEALMLESGYNESMADMRAWNILNGFRAWPGANIRIIAAR